MLERGRIIIDIRWWLIIHSSVHHPFLSYTSQNMIRHKASPEKLTSIRRIHEGDTHLLLHLSGLKVVGQDTNIRMRAAATRVDKQQKRGVSLKTRLTACSSYPSTSQSQDNAMYLGNYTYPMLKVVAGRPNDRRYRTKPSKKALAAE